LIQHFSLSLRGYGPPAEVKNLEKGRGFHFIRMKWNLAEVIHISAPKLLAVNC
jgi:hypothetical protein